MIERVAQSTPLVTKKPLDNPSVPQAIMQCPEDVNKMRDHLETFHYNHQKRSEIGQRVTPQKKKH